MVVVYVADLEIPIVHPISEHNKARYNNKDERFSYLLIAPIIIAQLFMIPSNIIFIKYWLKDNLYNRILIKRACLLAMIAHTINFVATIVWNFIIVIYWEKHWKNEKGYSFVNLAYIIVSLLLYLYFMAIAHRFIIEMLYQMQKENN